MQQASGASAQARPPIRVPAPVPPTAEGASANLLQQYVERDRIDPDEPSSWDLPFKSKRVVAALLIVAAQDRLDDLPLILTPDATWGLPDTRQLGRRRIFDGDGGEAFFQAFRKAAQRFPANASWQNRPLLPGIQEMVRTGAEPMWSYWDAGSERIFVRQVLRDGRAQIDYVGFFEEREGLVPMRAEYGVPPDLTPPIRRPEGHDLSTGRQRVFPAGERVEGRERE